MAREPSVHDSQDVIEYSVSEVKKIGNDLELRPTTNTDAARLAELGYSDELKRDFSLPALLGLCLCLMGTWEATSAVLAQALQSGGPPCLWYNFLITFLCTIAIGLSLAEIASIYPTSGGQYHWVSGLFPAHGRMTAAWVTGWVSIGSQIVMAASAAFLAGTLTQGLIILNNPSYVPERWHVTLIYWAFLLYSFFLNFSGNKVLPIANLISGILHVGGFVAVFTVLAVTAKKTTSSHVFTETINESGWRNDGIAWLVGMISTLYPFLGYDAAAHLAEELPHARLNVPRAMMGSIIANGLIGLAYVTMLLYSTGPLKEVMATATGAPAIQIYFDAVQSRTGTILMTLVSILTAIAATAASVTSGSRTLWAFARDSATPFDSFVGHINPKVKVPTNAVCIVVVLDALLGLIYIGNPTATNAILSTALICMYLSYLAPIVCMLVWGRRRLSASEYGPFKLGKPLGFVMNIISILWIVLSIAFSVLPSVRPVTRENMNYSSVVFVGWTLFGILYFWIWGRKKFQMPVVLVGVAPIVSHTI